MAVTIGYGAAPTYVKIASQTSGAVASVTFSNIPQGYTDLVIITNLKSSATPTSYSPTIYFNGDTTKTNYSYTAMYGDGSSAVSFRWTTSTATQHGAMATAVSATNFNAGVINIQNYSNATTYKPVLTRSADAANVAYATVGRWASTAAITSITFAAADGNKTFASGSTFTIYGIKAALVPKASGGDIIVQDGSYWYHAFKTTGAFTPKQAVTAEVMVVAGGSGGFRGAGGAGGFRVLTGQSLTASVNYVATVGAGTAEGGGANNSSFAGSGITTINATAGGYGGSAPGPGASGGSGGGGARSGAAGSYNGGAGNAGGYTPVEGYAGGNPSSTAGSYMDSGGGGGAGGVGSNAASAGNGGAGGVGTSAYSSWGLITNTGHNVSGTVYYAGGGGGTGDNATTAAVGGSGGGGAGEGNTTSAVDGLANTGGGGGAGYYRRYARGGSGLIIVRYPI